MSKLVRAANKAPNRSVRNRNFEQSRNLRKSMLCFGICQRRARRIYRQAVAHMKHIDAHRSDFPLDTDVLGSFIWDMGGAAGKELHELYAAIPHREFEAFTAEMYAFRAKANATLDWRISWLYGPTY